MPSSVHPWWTDSITVTRAKLKDQRGTKVRDWSDTTTRVIDGCCLIDGTTSTNWLDPRQAQESGASVCLPIGSDIQADDRVEHAGRTWSVDGVPATHRSPTGRVSHMRARLKEWSG